ncbi:MAG: hypothetical protein GY791_13685 [Alphaproteobacteria bacterium]|nr:hypothetical protein [Alphaproteobacteria bacterium]
MATSGKGFRGDDDGRGLPFPRKFLIGAAIGSGNTALAAEHGGADILLAINAGRLRNMGAPSIACMLPIFDADNLTDRFAREELLVQCRIPVLLGVNVWEPDFDPVGKAEAIRDAGFAGAVNFPSCMHYSRPMQQLLARAGRGIEREVELLRAAQDVGLTSMFYCATRTQARLAADAAIDLICLNLGWNVGGVFGHRGRATIEEVATVAREVGRLIKRINPATRFLLEGGPIVTAEDLGRIVNLAPIDGYVGGSTIERIPLEVSVADQIDRFRHASKHGAELDSDDSGLVAWARQFGLVGTSRPHLAFLRRLRALASASEPVLLLAERGIGAMPALKALSAPKGQARASAIVTVDVAGEDRPVRARNILFGHRDTITRRRPALADSEIGLLVIRAPERLPPATQRRLARALRDGAFRAVGTRRPLPVVPRLALVCDFPVAEGHEEEALAGAGLEPELIAHMTGWTLRLPPLRERIDDLMTVIEAMTADSLSVAVDWSRFSAAAAKQLHAHHWPGNEAELRALLGALADRSWDEPVQPSELLPVLEQDADAAPVIRTEKDSIVDALWRHGFNRTETAAALGISRKTLYNKIKKYGLDG